jgi:hypothetical protein
MNNRPRSVTVISWIFMAAGMIGLAYHSTEFKIQRPFDNDAVWVCFVRLLALVGGVFMLHGCNWARWLLVAWMGFHIILSALHSPFELLVHGLLFSVIGYFIFRQSSSAYFRGMKPVPPQIPKNDDAPVA